MEPEQLQQLRGTAVVDPAGEQVGEIDQIYVDEPTRKPEWMLVNTGILGTKPVILPLRGASRSGDALRVPFRKDKVDAAPDIEPRRVLSPAEESALYRHYGC